jgi:hypothetical protein
MKKLPILVLIFSIHFVSLTQLVGQVNYYSKYCQYHGKDDNGVHIYGTATVFPNNLVADDYGPRQLKNRLYDWHGGIDFNSPDDGIDGNGSDKNDLVLAIDGGIISPTSQVNINGFKWITVVGDTRNITYEHIGGDETPFSPREYGGCIIQRLDPGFVTDQNDRQNWAIIFRINGTYSAIGPINDSKVTFIDETGQSRTLKVKNKVENGAPLAPLGDSGGEPHLHVQFMSFLYEPNGAMIDPGTHIGDKYAKNPLELLSHNSPSYTITNGKIINNNDIVSGDILAAYPGDNKTPIVAKIQLNGEEDSAIKRYANSIVDIERVEFKISVAGNNVWSNIAGDDADKIQFGGKLYASTTVSPNNLRTQGVGSSSLTGVRPHMYFDHPYDIFFFSDFYVRLHSNDKIDQGPGLFSNYPWDTRYKDNNYEMKVAITRANEDNAEATPWSAPNYFSIDNFPPFVKTVSVFFSNGGCSGSNVQSQLGAPVYKANWDPIGDGKIKIGKIERRGVSENNPGSLTIFAVTSERINGNLKAYINGVTNWVDGVEENYNPQTGNQTWKFELGSGHTFVNNSCYQINSS